MALTRDSLEINRKIWSRSLRLWREHRRKYLLLSQRKTRGQTRQGSWMASYESDRVDIAFVCMLDRQLKGQPEPLDFGQERVESRWKLLCQARGRLRWIWVFAIFVFPQAFTPIESALIFV